MLLGSIVIINYTNVRRKINFIGLKFGKLTVVNRISEIGAKYTQYLVECECGRLKVVLSSNLLNGSTSSCGCNLRKPKRHGMAHTRIYRIWLGIHYRCKYHPDYKGRGIGVCPEWNVFNNFYNDMKDGYSDLLSIDRIDNEGDYEPSNCRWATQKTQAMNQRRSRIVEYNGELAHLKQVCERLDLDYNLVWSRIYKLKWDVCKAINTPTNKSYGHRESRQILTVKVKYC
jgi:hypothetical protein